MNDRIFSAKVLKTRGLAGELKVETPDARTDRFPKGMVLWTEAGDALTVTRFRQQGLYGFLTLQEISTIEQAAPLVGTSLYVEETDLPDPAPDHYYVKDLIGMQVEEEKGRTIGVLSEVTESLANDIYHVRKPDGGEILVPAVKAFVLSVKPEENRMRVRLIEGME